MDQLMHMHHGLPRTAAAVAFVRHQAPAHWLVWESSRRHTDCLGLRHGNRIASSYLARTGGANGTAAARGVEECGWGWWGTCYGVTGGVSWLWGMETDNLLEVGGDRASLEGDVNRPLSGFLGAC
jgi:hypothetical protein